MPKYRCCNKRCPALVDRPGKYCPTCEKRRQRDHDRTRGTAKERGYGKRWRKIRDRYIAEHPLCERCLEDNRHVPTQEVHHIVPLARGGTHDNENLQGLCKPCHSKVTMEDINRRRT